MDRLIEIVQRHPKLFVLTGAGCSTNSGIPDYRDADGAWKRPAPIELKAFMSSSLARRRYWARSVVGWPQFSAARPSLSHRALTTLQGLGVVHQLVTQNVDGLHSAARTKDVIDLHGRNDRVVCVVCGHGESRDRYQGALLNANPEYRHMTAALAPDGDADLDGVDFNRFVVPPCSSCGGVMRPDVVFFGDAVPRERVQAALDALEEADALLAVGTSLMVYSGFRFCRVAHEASKPILIINQGKTRADDIATHKVDLECARALQGLVRAMDPNKLAR